MTPAISATTVRRQETGTLALITIILGVTVVVSFSWSILLRFEQNQAVWSTYNQRINQINSGFFNINRQMGYGGFIHHFKDMLLSQDATRYGPLIEEDLKELDEELVRLRAVLVLPENRAYLDVIRNTFKTYEAKYRQAVVLLQQGNSGQDINRLLAMDDQPALDALHRMIKRADQLTHDTEIQAQSSATEVMQNLRTGGALVLLLILACGGIIMWQIHKLIGAYAQIQEHESQLTLALEHAEQASHAKTAFISNMSHELRTPMNSILGFAQLMETDPELPDDQRDSVQEILVAGRHLLRLINEVLDLARIEAGRTEYQLQPVALPALLQEVVQLMRVQASQAKVSLDLTVQPDAWALADRQKLLQSLLNLVSNGVKYNRAGGNVQIRSEARGSDWVRVVVSDTGLGIAPEHLPNIFEPFNRAGQANSNIPGTGIGLSLSQRWVLAMGGRMGVESTPGQGSTFWLELQRTREDAFIEVGKAI
ncbi:MAG TPA: HAMP domain-containing sensor histidine kinase [Macromonas sp.]|nr:HAMP domain-containing sensor histidine kinase [Macromonas sp.]